MKEVTTFAQWWEQQVEAGVRASLDGMRKMSDRLGTQPIGTRRASEREQLAQYLAKKDNPDYWRALFEDSMMGRTPEARVLRTMNGHVREMEALARAYRKEREEMNA